MVIQALKTPPGPENFFVAQGLKNAWAFQQDSLAYLTNLWSQYGDIVRTRIVYQQAIMLFHPEHARHVLAPDAPYDKQSGPMQTLQTLFGNGLFTVDGEGWHRQRRLVQPIFSHKHIQVLANSMIRSIDECMQQWSACQHAGNVFDMRTQMTNLATRAIARTLFAVEQQHDFYSIERQIKTLLSPQLSSYVLFPFPSLGAPTARNKSIRASIETFDQLIYTMIRQYRQRQDEGNDLFSLLLTAHDEQGEPMSDQQIRGEVMTMLLGGQETTSNTLAWICYVLATHTEVEQRVQLELDDVLADRPPTLETLARLPYLDLVIKEALRLYPASFVLARRSKQRDEIAGYTIPRNTLMCVLPYFIHRHPDFWKEPERFWPERFLPEAARGRDKFAYIPFGAGSRTCVATHFSDVFIKLTVATIMQRYKLRLPPNVIVEPTVRLTTMRPSELPMIVQPRAR